MLIARIGSFNESVHLAGVTRHLFSRMQSGSLAKRNSLGSLVLLSSISLVESVLRGSNRRLDMRKCSVEMPAHNLDTIHI